MKHVFIVAALLIAAMVGIASAGSCPGSCPNVNPLTNSIFPLNPSGCAEMPRLPHTFGGCLLINGKPAPEGTVVCIFGNGVAGNCLQVGQGGCFGLGTFDQKLQATGISVPGGVQNVREGEPLYFSCWYENNEYSCRVTTGSTTLVFTPFHSGHHTVVTLTSNNIPTGECPGCGY